MTKDEISASHDYSNDYHHLCGYLVPDRMASVGDKYYNLIRSYDILVVFKYFFGEANGRTDLTKTKSGIYFTNFIESSIKKHDLIKVFFEDKDGLKQTKFNRITERFNGQEILNIAELYFCRESFFKTIDFVGLLVDSGHLVGSDKERHLRILEKIEKIKLLSYPKIVEGIVELKSIANGERFFKPFWLLDEEEYSELTPTIKSSRRANKTYTNHRICIFIMSFLHKENLCNLATATNSEVWRLITKTCHENHKLQRTKTEQEKRLDFLREEMIKSLQLTDLIISKNDGEEHYYFGWKNSESTRKKTIKGKTQKRASDDFIEFRFGTFKNKFSSFKKEILTGD